MLASKLVLHDVRDVELYCARILHRANLNLPHHDSEDLLAYLVETCWELSLGYRPNGQPHRFSSYAAPILSRRIIDWQRKTRGRTTWKFATHTHHRPRPVLVSIDSVTPELDRLGASLGTWAGDPADGSDPAFGGLQAGGDRQRSRDFDALGLEPPPRAA
ncbi:MAG: sigma-70 family RNA polymerase sigma factor [Actinobacteria bacterium]|nr:sigma-70 family RNA polymerase sigma factor [Actinomycetota bacterium]